MSRCGQDKKATIKTPCQPPVAMLLPSSAPSFYVFVIITLRSSTHTP